MPRLGQAAAAEEIIAETVLGWDCEISELSAVAAKPLDNM
jgi:hypothetical protein